MEEKTILQLLEEYKQGEREFSNLSFSLNLNNHQEIRSLDLSGSHFSGCDFHSCEFSNTNLASCVFTSCNLKCVIITDCDLSNSKITSCSFESNAWHNIKLENITISDIHYFGYNLSQKDLPFLNEQFEKNWIESKTK